MGVPEFVRETPRTAIVLFVLLVISFIINTVGFGSASWLAHDFGISSYSTSISWGLWRLCVSFAGIEQCAEAPTLAGWFRVVQAMVTIGFIVTLVSLLLITLFVITAKFKSRMIAVCLIMASFATVVFNLIGIAVFRAKMEDGLSRSFREIALLVFTKDDISWSFYVTCAGTAMYLLSGIVAIVLMTGMRT